MFVPQRKRSLISEVERGSTLKTRSGERENKGSQEGKKGTGGGKLQLEYRGLAASPSPRSNSEWGKQGA